MPSAQTSTIMRAFARLSHAVWLGLFVGTGIGLGYLLAGVPGVQLMSLNAALAGATLGAGAGGLVGMLAAGFYSLGSPFGPAMPVILAAQMLGMAMAGLLGGIAAPVVRRLAAAPALALAGAVGLLSALALDLLTNVATAAALRLSLWPVLAAGLPFAAINAATSTAAFGLLFAPLARRLYQLRRRAPRATAGLLIVMTVLVGGARTASAGDPDGRPVAAPADTLAAAEADTFAAAAADTFAVPAADTTGVAAAPGLLPADRGRRHVLGWKRPLWQPFAGTLRDDLQRSGAWLPIVDGGHGAAVVYLGEASTTTGPRFERDGLPLGVGHRFLDDPEALVVAGRRVVTTSHGLAADGGMGGTVSLEARDDVPDRDLLDTRWYKGAHESYLRDVHFLTAAAPWRLGFAFGEVLDNEGYDFRVPGETRWSEFEDPFRGTFPGHAKARAGHLRVIRDLEAAGSVTLGIEQARKLRSALPAYGLEHQDLWHSRASLDWRGPAAGRPARLAFWWNDSDADWNRGRASDRKLEASTSGAVASWGDAAGFGRIDADWQAWSLLDSGAAAAWAGADTGMVRLRGESASVHGCRAWPVGGSNLALTVGGWWDRQVGWLVGGRAVLAEASPRPRWSASLERGGRAPRSDELATAWRFVVPDGRQTVVLPDRDLGREDEWRLGVAGSTRVAGLDLALGGAWRRLRDGIGWQPLEPGADTGRWQNGVALDGVTVRGSVAREGRFWGWLRFRADGTWRSWSQAEGPRIALPPGADWQLTALWENHFFQEDGILQLGWFLHNRGALDDPWFLSSAYRLPAITRLDMLIGFRLVGTDLGVELRNLAGGGSRLSAGAVDHGTELRWRLHWVFHY